MKMEIKTLDVGRPNFNIKTIIKVTQISTTITVSVEATKFIFVTTITQLPIPSIMWSPEAAFHSPIKMLESNNSL